MLVTTVVFRELKRPGWINRKRPVNPTYSPFPDRGMILSGGIVTEGSGFFDKSIVRRRLSKSPRDLGD